MPHVKLASGCSQLLALVIFFVVLAVQWCKFNLKIPLNRGINDGFEQGLCHKCVELAKLEMIIRSHLDIRSFEG